MLTAGSAHAGDRFAVVITGASGGETYAKKYQAWRTAFVGILRAKFNYTSDHIFVLAEETPPADSSLPATRESVKRVLTGLQKRLTKDDQTLILLIGHGTAADGDEAKFNLVGPDLSATEWADLVRPLPGRLVFVNATSASFPFLKKLAGRGRVVLTATDSLVQQFETVFPEFFIKAFTDPAADADRNGRVSIWEAFTYASAGVRDSFEQKGNLPTERPLLDDTGAGIGREAQAPGTDGTLARVTYLEPDAPLQLPSDSALAGLVKRRAELEAELEELKARRETMPKEQYEAALERILTELARVSAQIRTKS